MSTTDQTHMVGASPPDGPERSRRRTWLRIAVNLVLLFGVGLAAWLMFGRSPGPAPEGGGRVAVPREGQRPVPDLGQTAPQAGYLADVTLLRQHAALAAQGQQPYATAMQQLLDFADRALDESPQAVNPLKLTSDRRDRPWIQDSARAYGLGLAYAATGERRYAEQSAELVRAWSTTATSTERACPNSGGCDTSLPLSRHAPGFVFGARLIEDAQVLSERDQATFRAWLADVILPVTSERSNNWGDAGNFARIVITDYLGDEAGFDRAIGQWQGLMDLVESDGEIPEETRRGDSGLLYTQEALTYKVAIADIAAARGIDLWNYTGARGGTLKRAVDTLAYYWFRPGEWPYSDKEIDVPDPGPMWEIAYAQWREPAYLQILSAGRPYGDDTGNSSVLWTTLTASVTS